MTTGNEWQGGVGAVWASEWQRTDRCFGEMAAALNQAILAAAPAGPFAALDIGCGAGATTLALAAARPDARITAIELSPDLAAVATHRLAEAGAANAAVVVGDAAAEAARHGPVDLICSRHGVMFFPDPVAAFSALRAATRPGGRLVFSCFRDLALNRWAADLIAAATGGAGPLAAPVPPPFVPGPFAFADEGAVTAMLRQAGWQDVAAKPVDFRFIAGGGDDPVADANSHLARIGPVAALLRNTPPENRAAVLDRVTTVLRAHHEGDRVAFPAAAWLWSARAA